MTEEEIIGRCFVCNKSGRVYKTKVRGRTILLCKKHNKEYYGA
jgi:hypothetical protein